MTLHWVSWKNATRASRQRVRQCSLSVCPQTLRLCSIQISPIDYKFEHVDEPPPAHDDDEARRREEEELQRVLELSIQDKGGRKNWNEYSLASTSGAGGSGSQASTANQLAPATSSPSFSAAASAQQAHSTGYVPATETRTQTYAQPQTQTHAHPQTQLQTTTPTTGESSPQSSLAAPTSPTSSTGDAYAVTRVRALHSFKPTEPNELAFEKGDIIKVVDREYTDWWRGQLRGRTGIFPVNYVVRSRLTSNSTVTSTHILVASRNLFRNPP